MMIDSHAHIISDDVATYPPAPPSGALPTGALNAPLTAERLLQRMDEAGVDRALLVQRGSIYGFDNRYVCESAARYPGRFAPICAIDAAAADCGDQVRRWVAAGAVGVRLMALRKGQELDWLSGDDAMRAWAAAADLDIPVCVHFFPFNRIAGLVALRDILAALPGIRLVIDHFSNMDTLSGPPDHGLDAALTHFAAQDNVVLKFTTIPLGYLHNAQIDARPVIRRMIDAFGANRLMWGSDIGQSPGDYAFQLGLAREALLSLPTEQRALLLGGTAAAVYGGAWRQSIVRKSGNRFFAPSDATTKT